MENSKLFDGGFIVVLLLIAVGLVALAVPRLDAHGITISAEHILWNVDQGTLAPDSPAVDLARVAYERAYEVGVDSAYFSIRRGSSLMAQLNSVSEKDLPTAIASLRDAYTSVLKQRPMYARSWTRLAMVSLREGGDPAELMRFYEASYTIGPHDYRLRVMRIWLGVRLWEDLTDELRKNVRNDAETLWRQKRGDLADIYFHSSLRQRVLLRSLLPTVKDGENLGRLTQGLVDQGRL
ncbi:MAG: hypothetical protein KUG61_05915 [Parvibaculaceae bacterium]|nr:hypothetical protein [Parvibaculaceae bacterium]